MSHPKGPLFNFSSGRVLRFELGFEAKSLYNFVAPSGEQHRHVVDGSTIRLNEFMD